MQNLTASTGMLAVLIASAAVCSGQEESVSTEHSIAAIQEGRFHGWPANNGVWQWGDEILVGFTQGDFIDKSGHNIGERQDTLLSRSLDGGQTWKMFDPGNLLDDGHPKFLGKDKQPLDRPIDFSNPDVALRIFAEGYHGNDDPGGGFFYSYDRGTSWQGSYAFTGLTDHPELSGMDLSPRTDYLLQGPDSCFIYFSAHPSEGRLNRIGCMETHDGGRTFAFKSWVTPESNTANAIMSQTVQISDDRFILAFRKIVRESDTPDSIEAYESADGCETWKHLSTIKVMQTHSNPPALVAMNDGRLCCAYGDRHTGEIRARYSNDKGKTWGPEFIVRDDYQAGESDPDSRPDGFADMGYVRMVQRPDGHLVAMYYYATADHPEHHIAVSIWQP